MVSVIIPVYNTESKLVRRCVDSLLKQKYDEVEIIVAFNGCSEEYIDNIKSDIYSCKVRFLEIPEKGVSKARNAGICEAKGEYIAFADADDTVTENYLEEAVEMIEGNNLDMVSGGMSIMYRSDSTEMLIKKNSLEIVKGDIFRQYILFADEEPESSKIKNNNFLSPCAKLYKKDILKGVRFHEDMTCGEDLVFNYEVASRTDRIGIVGKIWYIYYQYDHSAMHSLDERMIKNSVLIISEINRINTTSAMNGVLKRKFAKLFYIYIFEAAAHSGYYGKWKESVNRLFHDVEFDDFKNGIFVDGRFWTIRHWLIFLIVFLRLYPIIYVMGKAKRRIHERRSQSQQHDLISLTEISK